MPRTVSALHPCLLHFTPPIIVTPQKTLFASTSNCLPPCPCSLHSSTQIIFYKTKVAMLAHVISFSLPLHQDKDNTHHTLAYYHLPATNCEVGH